VRAGQGNSKGGGSVLRSRLPGNEAGRPCARWKKRITNWQGRTAALAR